MSFNSTDETMSYAYLAEHVLVKALYWLDISYVLRFYLGVLHSLLWTFD